MLTADEFLTHLEELDTADAQHLLVEQSAGCLTDETVQQLKARANDVLAADIGRGITLADTIVYAAQVSGKPLHRALGLMVQANALTKQGLHQQAIALYDEAQRVALTVGNTVEAARSQVGKIGALMYLGDYTQAIEIAGRIINPLLEAGETISAATLYGNVAICYSWLRDFQKAVTESQRAQALLEAAGTVAAHKQLRYVLNNIAINLRELGRYHEALEYSLRACEIARQYNFVADEAIYQQNTAAFYYAMGDYNKALRILHNTRDILEKNKLIPNLVDCEYFLYECYLELGRYEEAVEQARSSLQRFKADGHSVVYFEAFTHLFMGQALIALNRVAEAVEVLSVAQSLIEQAGVSSVKHYNDLHLAQIYLLQNKTAQAETLIKNLLAFSDNLKLNAAAQLLLARIYTSRDELDAARALINQTIQIFKAENLNSGLYQAYYQLAEISEQEADLPTALAWFERSIDRLEHLRGRIATETRSTFLRSKEKSYEGAVTLSLLSDQPERAFNLVERVKSRALVELVSNQLDIRVRVRAEPDRPLVEEIESLRIRHNDLTRQQANWRISTSERNALTTELLKCEKRLAELTEKLQVRNALYAEDATLTTAYQAFDFSLLEPDQVLVEYYIARGELVAFVATSSGVKAVRNLTTTAQLTRQLSLFRLNLGGMVKSLADPNQMPTSRMDGLIANSRALLQKLFTTLFEPLKELVADYRHLIVVPHQALHYLPFHALYNPNSAKYLLEEFEEISYLPSASLLRFCQQRARQASGAGALVFGFSNNDALPCTVQEAHTVAEILRKNDNPACIERVEDAANLHSFRLEASGKRIIHLATHGRYRDDAPLFSSLLLAGGELTGHEIFNMELQASLVTLSACDTGLGAIGGGDEVLGLSRACLYAGASSLALSLWRVNDQAGAILMSAFYSNLFKGQTKARALCEAQRTLLENPAYRHPFYWAAFVLTGDSGPL